MNGDAEKFEPEVIARKILEALADTVSSVLRFCAAETEGSESRFMDDRFDIVAAAMQLSVGAICSRSKDYSKTNSRRYLIMRRLWATLFARMLTNSDVLTPSLPLGILLWRVVS